MPRKIRDVEQPEGLMKWLFDLPNWFFDHGMGGWFRKRFVRIHHIGRNSGRKYQTVVEVVKADLDQDKIFVCAAFGRQSDWYQNVMKEPDVRVDFNCETLKASMRELPPEEGGDVFADYARRHPLAIRILARVMGYETDGTPDDVRQIGEELPVLEIKLKE